MKKPKTTQPPEAAGKVFQINTGFPEPEVVAPSPSDLLNKLTEYAEKLTAFELEYRHSQSQDTNRPIRVSSLDSLKNKAAFKIKQPASKDSSEPPLDATKIKSFPSGPSATKSEKSSKGE